MANEKIVIRGARAHNLKNIDVTIPKNKLVVITGLSGSGKSSLAFDTLYAEGQRRYVESLSAYARQFLGQMDKPDVDSIEGLSPAISIDQKTTSHNPRSTVGTVTEINDFLRLLWARVGTPLCPTHGVPIASQSPEQMVNQILELPERTRLQVLAPVVHEKRGTQKAVLAKIKKDGFVRVQVDGETYDVDEVPELDKNKKHSIDVVVDRIIVKDGVRSRLFDSFEAALRLADGVAVADIIGGEKIPFSEHYACPYGDFSMPELEPRLFSFNAPLGACPVCEGLGSKLEVDVDLVVPDQTKTLNEGALVPWNPISSKYYPSLLAQYCAAAGIDMDTPFEDFDDQTKHQLLYGDDLTFHFHYQNDFGGIRDVDVTFEGVVNNVSRRYKETNSDFTREQMRKYMAELPCPACHGYRLNEQALAVKVAGQNIGQVSELPISEEIDFFQRVHLSEQDQEIARPILKEILDRLTFMQNVGVEYLTLSRSARTLSGGEAQRIRLATQIGSNLSGVMYVLDEPSIGLHQRDNDRLINSLKKMRDLGNTLIVVEHDEDTMRAADYIIDIGPGAGEDGGQVMAAGTPKQIMRSRKSLTGKYLSGREMIPVPSERRSGNGHVLTLVGAKENNLKDITVKFPLGKFICVTGVSGSGKSTLVNQILKRILAQQLNRASDKPGRYKEIRGLENVEKVIDIDQSPIGRTPRSNPATYTGVFTDIRTVFSQTQEAKMRGYGPGRFSFNVKGGRCEACEGDGIIQIAMHFLPDIYVPCEVCKGARYNRETLEVKYKGKTITDVLNMTVEEACTFFENIPKIHRKIKTLVDVGLGYIQMGRSATTLSGGEAERVKLALELAKPGTGKTVYIMDEPTTGLHVDDVHKLVKVIDRLVEAGNTVIIIEHNLDVIKRADHIIDLGPEGGNAGGMIVAQGTPEEVALCEASYTGQYLRPMLPRPESGAAAPVEKKRTRRKKTE